MRTVLTIVLLFATGLCFSQTSYENLGQQIVVVNSQWALAKKARNIASFHLPSNATGYIYRIIPSQGGKKVSNSLFDLVSKVSSTNVSFGIQLTKYLVEVNDDNAIDAYIFQDKSSADNFYAFKSDWRACNSMPNRRSICMASHECINRYDRDVYFGFENNNITQGVDVSVEVVALVDKSMEQSTSTFKPRFNPTREIGVAGLSSTGIHLSGLYTYSIYNKTLFDNVNAQISTDGSNYRTYLIKPLDTLKPVFTAKTVYIKLYSNSTPVILNAGKKYKIQKVNNEYKVYFD